MRAADVALRQCSSVEALRDIVDEARTLINESKVSGVEVGRLSHGQAIQSLVALSALIKLVDGIQYRQVEHVASLCPFFALTAADRI